MNNYRATSPLMSQPKSPRNKMNLELFSLNTPSSSNTKSFRSSFKNSFGSPSGSVSTNLNSIEYLNTEFNVVSNSTFNIKKK